MGFNLTLGCHDCRVEAMAYRGHEAEAIREWTGEHPNHQRDCYVDHGFQSEPDWAIDYESAGALPRWLDEDLSRDI